MPKTAIPRASSSWKEWNSSKPTMTPARAKAKTLKSGSNSPIVMVDHRVGTESKWARWDPALQRFGIIVQSAVAIGPTILKEVHILNVSWWTVIGVTLGLFLVVAAVRYLPRVIRASIKAVGPEPPRLDPKTHTELRARIVLKNGFDICNAEQTFVLTWTRSGEDVDQVIVGCPPCGKPLALSPDNFITHMRTCTLLTCPRCDYKAVIEESIEEVIKGLKRIVYAHLRASGQL